jgi:hypothetical protein
VFVTLDMYAPLGIHVAKAQIHFFSAKNKRNFVQNRESGVASLKVVYRTLSTCNALFISVSQRTDVTIFTVEFLVTGVFQKLFPFTSEDVV